MSRRAPLPYADHELPRGTSRPDPSYDSRGGAPSLPYNNNNNARPSRPRAGDFMPDAAPHSFSAGGGRYAGGGGGGREADWRDRGARDRSRSPRRAEFSSRRSRSPPPPPRDYARRSPPPPARDSHREREYERDNHRAPPPPPRANGRDRDEFARDGRDDYRRNGDRHEAPYSRDERGYERDSRGGARDDRDRDDRRGADVRMSDSTRDRTERALSHSASIASETGQDADTGAAEGEEEDDAEAAMAAMMGFGGFGSTAGQKVQDNLTAVAIRKERKSRQYMNRRGGFNRPLDRMS